MYHKSIHFNTIYPHIYKKTISIPESVTIKIKNDCIFITGKLGTLMHEIHHSINIQLHEFKYLDICSNTITANSKALIGTIRSLINGMIIGVTLGFIKKLQLVGIGYRAYINDSNIITFTIGLSHSINYVLPKGISARCLNNTEIVLNGINKQLIGQVAANLRSIKPPEPFKGKGIRYLDEIVRNKDTKKR